jgi:predicted peptidase
MKSILPLILLFTLTACKDIKSDFVSGAEGFAGQHTPVIRDSQGNQFGYYEYLPKNFNLNESHDLPIIFYWNGINALTGNGREDIDRLLTQGLTLYIHEGHHYPAIIISGMLPNWSKDDPHYFVEYILKKYEQYVDPSRVYMTGFSAGGGVTVRYAAEHPEYLAAILPVSPAVQAPSNDQALLAMAKVPSWFFHNSGDMSVEIWHSNVWHKALKNRGGEHRITRPDKDTHYAWKEAYANKTLWHWLLKQRKGISK